MRLDPIVTSNFVVKTGTGIAKKGKKPTVAAVTPLIMEDNRLDRTLMGEDKLAENVRRYRVLFLFFVTLINDIYKHMAKLETKVDPPS
jgi:hypothetical protein